MIKPKRLKKTNKNLRYYHDLCLSKPEKLSIQQASWKNTLRFTYSEDTRTLRIQYIYPKTKTMEVTSTKTLRHLKRPRLDPYSATKLKLQIKSPKSNKNLYCSRNHSINHNLCFHINSGEALHWLHWVRAKPHLTGPHFPVPILLLKTNKKHI